MRVFTRDYSGRRMDNDNDTKFNRQEAAEYLGVTTQTLRNWELERRGPRFTRIGKWRLWYWQSDLDAFIAAGEFKPDDEEASNG